MSESNPNSVYESRIQDIVRSDVVTLRADDTIHAVLELFMSEAITTIGVDTTLGQATRRMLRNRVHHLAVVGDSEQLIKACA